MQILWQGGGKMVHGINEGGDVLHGCTKHGRS